MVSVTIAAHPGEPMPSMISSADTRRPVSSSG